MCLGMAGQVVGPRTKRTSDVEVAGVVRPINVSLLDGPFEPGEYVLIHSGFALERMTPEAPDAMAVLGGPGWRRGRHVTAGPALFVRYAFAPNSHGYCGPGDAAGCSGTALAGRGGPGFRRWRRRSTAPGPNCG